VVSSLLSALVWLSLGLKMAITVALIASVGFVMGVPFPVGLARLEEWHPARGTLPLPPNRGLGVVVPPVEPIVFEHGDTLKAHAFGFPGDGAALEVPLAAG